MNNSSPSFYRRPDGQYVRPRLNIDQLKLLNKITPEVSGSLYGKSYGVATLLLSKLFGYKWLEKHVLDEPQNGFFGRPLGNLNGEDIVIHRVRLLAEMLFNFNSVPGVDAPYAQIADGHIESGYAELESGRILATCERPFKFILPSKTLGSSYDIEFESRNKLRVCADTKCKIESSDYSAKSIENTIFKARTQLPKSGIGSIILNIPSDWYSDPNKMLEISERCKKLFRQTDRVHSIFVFSSFVKIADGILHDWQEAVELVNDTASADRDGMISDAGVSFSYVNPKNWVRFIDITGENTLLSDN